MKNNKTYSQLKVNQDFKRQLANIIYENSKDHELYFVTFTFKDQFKSINEDVIIGYFKAFYQKLNQRIVNNPSRYGHFKSKIILVPEKSIDNTKGNLVKTRHYHGVLMINKMRSAKFYSQCLLNKKKVYEHSKIKKEPHFVERMILDPSLVHLKVRTGLSVYSTDIQKIKVSRLNIGSVCSYITKNIDVSGYSGFNACDALYFCDTSKTNLKNYKPIKQLKIRHLFTTTDDKDLSPFRRKLKAQNNSFLERFFERYGIFR